MAISRPAPWSRARPDGTWNQSVGTFCACEQVASSRLTAFAMVAAGAALAGIGLSGALAEVAPYFNSGIQPEQRFAALAAGEFVPAASRWSRNLFLNDCLDVPRSTYGLAQPPEQRDVLFETCRREAQAIVASTPTASSAWLVIAVASGGLGDYEAMLPALALSRRTAPNLQWYADRRSRLAEAHFDHLDQTALADYRADLATLAAGRAGVAVLAQRYVRQPEHREAYQQAVEAAGPGQQQVFLDAVRRQLGNAS